MAPIVGLCLPFAATCLVLLPFASAQEKPDKQDQRVVDPRLEVCAITSSSFTLQWFTREPCRTLVQVRAGNLPCNTPLSGERAGDSLEQRIARAWQGARTLSAGGSRQTVQHRLVVAGRKPGRRYFYRIGEPGLVPDDEEARWGASLGWRRECAVATLAPKGKRTIIHLPVKVLLMPNIVDLTSWVPGARPPAKMTAAELELVKSEYRKSALFLFVNSGFRLALDLHFLVDDRWQRWDDEDPDGLPEILQGLPTCRSWGGKDYVGPGGGRLLYVSANKPLAGDLRPPFAGEERYFGQVENAFPRRYDRRRERWHYMVSGGGTYGLNRWYAGVPGRSQFLGGGDLAWLFTHEFHHQLESGSRFSGQHREDDRISFNHYAPTRRVVEKDVEGRPTETKIQIWNFAGPHGSHYDGMRWFDRGRSDAQWLRWLWGEPIVVADADADGLPDAAPQLPFDEARFGSDPAKVSTDGSGMSDKAKAMLSNWVDQPLNPTFAKNGVSCARRPSPTSADSDGDGLPDGSDPAPLYPWSPLVRYGAAAIDATHCLSSIL